MTYERRNIAMREQYKTLMRCIKCRGQDTCELYTNLGDEGSKYCVWFETLLHDKKKINTGGILTFPNLENILNNEDNLKLPELKEFLKLSEDYCK